MIIERSGSKPSSKGPEDWFTGEVRIDPLASPPEPARVTAASVTFEPGARTAWHTHPAGQTILITFGRGRVQREGGPVEEVAPGDVVSFAPNEKHWHPGQRKRIKRLAHQRDRRAAKQNLENEDIQKYA